jgi:exodeoxyribonuclease V alpha subunit
VVIPLTTQHYAMLARNLLYTGVTRAKRLVVLIGQRRALGIAVRNGAARRRWTRLEEWLGGASMPDSRVQECGRSLLGAGLAATSATEV